MSWYEFLIAPTGEPVRAITVPDSLAIFPITIEIRPRLILIARFPDGGDMLLIVLYHSTEQCMRSHLRYRDPSGEKYEPGLPHWIAVPDGDELKERLQSIAREFRAAASATGAEVVEAEVPADASDEELLAILQSNNLLDDTMLYPDFDVDLDQ